MEKLEDLLRDTAKKGQLNHVSVIAHTDRQGVVTFRAAWRDTKRDGRRFAEHADPATALANVLKGVKS